MCKGMLHTDIFVICVRVCVCVCVCMYGASHNTNMVHSKQCLKHVQIYQQITEILVQM